MCKYFKDISKIISMKFFKVTQVQCPILSFCIFSLQDMSQWYGNGAPPVLLYLIGCLDTGLTSAEERAFWHAILTDIKTVQ